MPFPAHSRTRTAEYLCLQESDFRRFAIAMEGNAKWFGTGWMGRRPVRTCPRTPHVEAPDPGNAEVGLRATSLSSIDWTSSVPISRLLSSQTILSLIDCQRL